MECMEASVRSYYLDSATDSSLEITSDCCEVARPDQRAQQNTGVLRRGTSLDDVTVAPPPSQRANRNQNSFSIAVRMFSRVSVRGYLPPGTSDIYHQQPGVKPRPRPKPKAKESAAIRTPSSKAASFAPPESTDASFSETDTGSSSQPPKDSPQGLQRRCS